MNATSCKACLHSVFEGDQKDERGREIGLCIYNPPTVVVIHVPDVEAMKAAISGRILAGSKREPEGAHIIMREVPIGAFPVVAATMRCRLFHPRNG